MLEVNQRGGRKRTTFVRVGEREKESIKGRKKVGEEGEGQFGSLAY